MGEGGRKRKRRRGSDAEEGGGGMERGEKTVARVGRGEVKERKEKEP